MSVGSRLRESRARRPTPDRAPPSNADLVAGWEKVESVRLQDVSFRSYRMRVRLFMNFVGEEPLVSIRRADVWDYIDTDLTEGPRGCSFYQSKGVGVDYPVCLKRLDLRQCNLSCQQRRQILPETLEHHLYPLVSLFEYLYRREFVETNVATEVLKELTERHARSEPKPKVRRFTTEEIEKLLRGTPQLHLKAGFAIPALTAVRAGELQRLRVSPQYLDLRAGWLEVPYIPKQKRVGETKLWLTDELRDWLEDSYMPWWNRRVKKRADGTPRHDGLLLTARGTHWTGYRTFNEAWHRQLEKLGILNGTEDECNTLTPHDMRHWLTTELNRTKAPDYFVALYRGDKRGVISDEYTHFTDEEKRREFLHYAPRIKIT